ncbi:hypothetical protein GQ457_17G012740 [Hibiscus cannabinus]
MCGGGTLAFMVPTSGPEQWVQRCRTVGAEVHAYRPAVSALSLMDLLNLPWHFRLASSSQFAMAFPDHFHLHITTNNNLPHHIAIFIKYSTNTTPFHQMQLYATKCIYMKLNEPLDNQ